LPWDLQLDAVRRTSAANETNQCNTCDGMEENGARKIVAKNYSRAGKIDLILFPSLPMAVQA